jgi:hypothetical protein
MFIGLRHLVAYGENATIWVIRDTYPALMQYAEDFHSLLIDAFGLKAVHRNKAENSIRIAGGGQVLFTQIDSAESFKRLQGQEATLIIYEELGLAKEMRFLDLARSSLRSAAGVPTRVVATANPGGPQHSHIHLNYISQALPNHPFQHRDGTMWVVSPSNIDDNPHIDAADYDRNLRAATGPDDALYRAWRFGDWNIARGAFFASVIDQKKQMLPANYFANTRIQGKYTYIAGDWGTRHPACFYLCYESPPGLPGITPNSLILLDEVETVDWKSGDLNRGLELPPSVVAELLLERCAHGGTRKSGVVDDAYGLHGPHDTLIEIFKKEGLAFRKPEKGRLSGWAAMSNRLHAVKEGTGEPGMYVSERCKLWWQTVPTLARSDKRPEDVDTNGPDHAADASRYAATHIAKKRNITYGRVAGW